MFSTNSFILFTKFSLSDSYESLKQVLLPDKEFRYLRTVIVTAAVHRGFSSKRKPLPLTFRHRAGVSPYTSTFVLAQTYVFGKQLHGLLSCGPLIVPTIPASHAPWREW